MGNNAIVLSGGGVSGVAWEVGVLAGIADADADLAERLREPGATFVGTSAGAVVASQFAGGLGLQELYDLQLLDDREIGASFDMGSLADTAQQVLAGATSPSDIRQRLADLVRGGFAAAPGDRRAVLAARLPIQNWPDARLLITAVDAADESLRVFDGDVNLVDAVTASSAVPLVWPAVTIDGRQYVDGGLRSSTNADVAAGASRVLVLAASSSGAGVSPSERRALEPAPILVIAADEVSVKAFGPNSLDTATRAASAAAGRAQGARVAAEVRKFWV